MMARITGGQALVRALAAAGVDTVFAVPGVQLDWIFHALQIEASPIRVIVPRHEQATTYMADGYARTSGKLGVAIVVPGPGVLNAMAGLATAYASHSRVLLIAGQIRSTAMGRQLGLLHEIADQGAVLSSCTKAVYTVSSASELTRTMEDAIDAIDQGRRRPVAVQVPHDLLEAYTESAESSKAIARSSVPVDREPAPDPAAVQRAAALLQAARHPVIYAGGGVAISGAQMELRALAEKLGAPVVMSENGRGVLSDDHHLAFSTPGGQSVFASADVVLVVGSRFIDLLSGQPLWRRDGVRYIGLNIDPAELGEPRAYAVVLRAGARRGLAALAEIMPAAGDREHRMRALTDIRRQARERIAALGTLSDYVDALRSAIPSEAVLVNELTQVGYLCRVAYPVSRPGELLSPGYQGTLGYAFATGLGAAIGAGRRTFAISGDGGFGWSMQELSTAARYQIPLTLVVFNDGRFANVHALQMAQFGFSREVELCNPDFGDLARAFSVRFVRADSPAELAAAIRDTSELAGPVLIEVRVGQMANPWPLMRLQPLVQTQPQQETKDHEQT